MTPQYVNRMFFPLISFAITRSHTSGLVIIEWRKQSQFEHKTKHERAYLNFSWTKHILFVIPTKWLLLQKKLKTKQTANSNQFAHDHVCSLITDLLIVVIMNLNPLMSLTGGINWYISTSLFLFSSECQLKFSRSMAVYRSPATKHNLVHLKCIKSFPCIISFNYYQRLPSKCSCRYVKLLIKINAYML